MFCEVYTPKLDKKLRWRCLTRLVAYLDMIGSLFSIGFAVHHGILFYEFFHNNKSQIEQLAINSHVNVDSIFVDLIWACVLTVLLISGAGCLCLVGYSTILYEATDKNVGLKAAVEGAFIWLHDMAKFLVLLCGLFFIFLWIFKITCVLVGIMLTIICIRVIFLSIVSSFVDELKQCIAYRSEQARDLEQVTVVDFKLNGIKTSNIYV